MGSPLVSSSGVGVLQLWARTPGVVRLVFDATPPTGAQRTLRVADSKAEQRFPLTAPTHIAVLVEIPRGQSQLLVKVDPAPTSEEDAVILSLPRAEHATGVPVLHADLISSTPGF